MVSPKSFQPHWVVLLFCALWWNFTQTGVFEDIVSEAAATILLTNSFYVTLRNLPPTDRFILFFFFLTVLF